MIAVKLRVSMDPGLPPVQTKKVVKAIVPSTHSSWPPTLALSPITRTRRLPPLLPTPVSLPLVPLSPTRVETNLRPRLHTLPLPSLTLSLRELFRPPVPKQLLVTPSVRRIPSALVSRPSHFLSPAYLATPRPRQEDIPRRHLLFLKLSRAQIPFLTNILAKRPVESTVLLLSPHLLTTDHPLLKINHPPRTLTSSLEP